MPFSLPLVFRRHIDFRRHNVVVHVVVDNVVVHVVVDTHDHFVGEGMMLEGLMLEGIHAVVAVRSSYVVVVDDDVKEAGRDKPLKDLAGAVAHKVQVDAVENMCCTLALHYKVVLHKVVLHYKVVAVDHHTIENVVPHYKVVAVDLHMIASVVLRREDILLVVSTFLSCKQCLYRATICCLATNVFKRQCYSGTNL